jgi:L-ascorbate metabolism protein UlaG (beta-lactamase superfamily)
MRLRRLGWAGIEVEASGESLVVDLLIDPGIFGPFLGESRDELIEPEPGTASAALLTHLHRDHADIAAIERAVRHGGAVLRPLRRAVESPLDEFATGTAEAALERTALQVRECAVGDVVQLGPFTITALFASDGLGSPQLSWLIEADGQKLLHGGDTLWHGAWWDFAAAHGPIDVACLPANGVELSFPQWQPAANVPADLTPEQAVYAARALQARLLVPIHFNRTFEHPEYYRPVPDAGEQLDALAAQLGVQTLFLQPGEWTDVLAPATR